jgi:imidazolonepropionase-like amidohydrolase
MRVRGLSSSIWDWWKGPPSLLEITMRSLSALLLVLVVPPLLLAKPDQELASKPLAITHVTVIDAAGAPLQPDQTVAITNGRITQLGKTGTFDIPKDTQVVDAGGKFLIPGLWDMHVHIVTKDYLPLFIANGVTGVRDMHAFFPDTILQMRKDVRDGKVLGPHIVAAGALVDGPKPIWPGSYTASNAQEGRTAVQALKKRGADFVKVYTKLPREAFFAIAEEAKTQGLPFAGHVPESVSALEASDAGQKSMEHLYGITLACATKETELRKEVLEALAKSDNAAFMATLGRAHIKALDSYDENKAKVLFARFAKNGTWQVPTLTVLRSIANLTDERFTNDPRVKYMPPFLRSMWDPKGPADKSRLEAIAFRKIMYKKAPEIVSALHRAGVPILAGTDTSNPFCFPGFSLHDELALLVEAGLTPLEALQSATRDPAKYLDRLKDVGTVETGKIADLVLLDANPLDDIKNTQKIAAVVVGGKLLDKAALQKMLADVEAASKGGSPK